MLSWRGAKRTLSLIPLGLMACAPGAPEEGGAVQIPLHELAPGGGHSGDAAPLRVLRLSGPDGPEPGDVWELEAVAAGAGPHRFQWEATSGTLSSAEGARIRWTATEAVGRVEIRLRAVDADGVATSATLAARVTASAATGPLGDDYDTVGYFCTVALDSADNPHILYRDDTHPSLFYAGWDGSAWDVMLVEGFGLAVGGDAGYHASVAVTPAGMPVGAWFSYYPNANGSLRRALVYGQLEEGRWSTVELAEIDNAASFPLTLALNPFNGAREILYQRADGAAVMLARCVGSCLNPVNWLKEVVYEEGRSSAQFASYNTAYPGGLTIGADGVRHVTFGYEYRDDAYRAGMGYTRKGSTGGWLAPEILSTYNDDSFQDLHGARLSLDALGRPLALNQFGLWQRLGADDWAMSEYAAAVPNHIYRFALATDPGRTPPSVGEVYFTYANGNALELVETDDRGYFEFTWLGGISTSARARTGVVVDSQGAPHVCWANAGDLQYR